MYLCFFNSLFLPLMISWQLCQDVLISFCICAPSNFSHEPPSLGYGYIAFVCKFALSRFTCVCRFDCLKRCGLQECIFCVFSFLGAVGCFGGGGDGTGQDEVRPGLERFARNSEPKVEQAKQSRKGTETKNKSKAEKS